MVNIRKILPTLLLTTFFGRHAIAYQYDYYSPYPVSIPGYGARFLSAPYPYYPGYRYPVQPGYRQAPTPARLPAATSRSTDAPAIVKHKPGQIAVSPDTDKAAPAVSADKRAFITKLLPYIEQENRRLTVLRQNIASLFDKLDGAAGLSSAEQREISRLARQYRVNADPLQDRAAREEMLSKIDIIPVSLALAQAVNESAWGQSRFAREANNLFGIWTYDQDKGLKPLNREPGKTHLVRIFDDVGESVRYYMYNLNSHPAYQQLRAIRQQLRASGQVIDGHEMAAGLAKYSAKGQAYIDLIRSLIRRNQWAQLDTDVPRG